MKNETYSEMLIREDQSYTEQIAQNEEEIKTLKKDRENVREEMRAYKATGITPEKYIGWFKSE